MNIELLNKVYKQVRECREKYGSYASRHEFLGVLIEEIEELKQEIFKKEPDFDRLGAEIVDCLTVLIKGYGDIVDCRNDR
jgi:NTP pyrophosphatase (non-canonical NTP hydrolase)